MPYKNNRNYIDWEDLYERVFDYKCNILGYANQSYGGMSFDGRMFDIF